MTEAELRGFFRSIYLIAAMVLAALTALCWALWGWRAGAGMATGGGISIGVLLTWQWLASWILAAPGGRGRRRLIIVWPLKYAVMGGILYGLLRWDLVNVFALIVGLGLIQMVIFGRALVMVRPLLTAGAADMQNNPPKGDD